MTLASHPQDPVTLEVPMRPALLRDCDPLALLMLCRCSYDDSSRSFTVIKNPGRPTLIEVDRMKGADDGDDGPDPKSRFQTVCSRKG
jgi:hypothetical protein